MNQWSSSVMITYCTGLTKKYNAPLSDVGWWCGSYPTRQQCNPSTVFSKKVLSKKSPLLHAKYFSSGSTLSSCLQWKCWLRWDERTVGNGVKALDRQQQQMNRMGHEHRIETSLARLTGRRDQTMIRTEIEGSCSEWWAEWRRDIRDRVLGARQGPSYHVRWYRCFPLSYSNSFEALPLTTLSLVRRAPAWAL